MEAVAALTAVEASPVAEVSMEADPPGDITVAAPAPTAGVVPIAVAARTAAVAPMGACGESRDHPADRNHRTLGRLRDKVSATPLRAGTPFSVAPETA